MVCGSKEGLYSHALIQVLCSCEDCGSSGSSGSGSGGSSGSSRRDPRLLGSGGGGGGIWHRLSEFEKHGGRGGSKKPKHSITIKATREGGGQWRGGVAFSSAARQTAAVYQTAVCLPPEVLPCSACHDLRTNTHEPIRAALPLQTSAWEPGWRHRTAARQRQRRRLAGTRRRCMPCRHAGHAMFDAHVCCQLDLGLLDTSTSQPTHQQHTMCTDCPAGQQLEATRRHPPPPASLAAAPTPALQLLPSQAARLSRAANRSL